MISYIFCLSQNEVPIGNALFVTTYFSTMNASSAHGYLVKGQLYISLLVNLN